MTKEPPKRASERLIGGLGGTLSTAELQQARAAYGEYRVQFESGEAEGERKSFDDFIATMWKKKQ